MNISIKLCSIILLLGMATSASCSNSKGVSGSKDIEGLKKEYNELLAKRTSLEQEVHKHTPFWVRGEIVDRSEEAVSLFGSAQPRDGNYSHVGAARDSNIVVLNPGKINHPTIYIHERAFFVKKTTGKNAFGVSVPVLVFATDPPKDLGAIESKIARIDEELKRLSGQIVALEEKVKDEDFDKVKNSPEGLTKLADKYVLIGSDYVTSDQIDFAIREFRRALSIEPGHKVANGKLGVLLLKAGTDKKAAEHALQKYVSMVLADVTNLDGGVFNKKLLGISYKEGKENTVEVNSTEWDEAGEEAKIAFVLTTASTHCSLYTDQPRTGSRGDEFHVYAAVAQGGHLPTAAEIDKPHVVYTVARYYNSRGWLSVHNVGQYPIRICPQQQ